ncbi:hypothetical protein I551_8664 [Mycobacterium ulcerans str. Harvey]|uniref:DDE_Tnp_1-associated family protein n=1 Tax=Mycobacterium ulcerans str. Harvey TaxID=1299332 RepID=A0ABN0RA95_MYCUL|nr:hypothetical protein I551_8664 [Mycobacterium ulcerans str. Harvey]
MSWVDDLWCRAIGPQCRHGLSGERSSWLLSSLVWSARATVSVLPVSSVPEVFDRWSPGERSELIGSEFSMCWPRCQTEDPRGRRYSLMALLAIAVLATAAGCAAMLVLPLGGHRFR